MTPLHVHIGWWQSWRDLVRKIKQDPMCEMYQRAAVLAQAEYVMYAAQYFSEVR